MLVQQEKRGHKEEKTLRPLDVEAIDLFISFLRMLGLPKSIGEIYGLLFVSSRPLAMDDLIAQLNISAGAASQGLKLLRSLGAVKTVYVPGERRDHFVADLELSRFATSFIKEELQPRLDSGLSRLERMQELVKSLSAEERVDAEKRIAKLRHWLEKGNSLLPWVVKFLVH